MAAGKRGDVNWVTEVAKAAEWLERSPKGRRIRDLSRFLYNWFRRIVANREAQAEVQKLTGQSIMAGFSHA